MRRIFKPSRNPIIRRELKALRMPKLDEICMDVLRKYNVGLATVVICVDKYGVARYLIDEPPIDDLGKKIYGLLMDYLYTSTLRIENAEDLKKSIDDIAEDLGIEKELHERYEAIMYYIMRDAFGYGVLEVPMRDRDIEDIELSDWRRAVTVVHKDFLSYEALITNIVFENEEEVRALIERLALKTGKSISLAKPELHAVLPEGYRLAATLGDPVSISPTFDIRKLPDVPIDIVTLIRQGVVNSTIAALLWLVNEAKLFYAIIGGSGTGKTTLLNAILQLTNPNWKIIVVQDVPEIKLPSRSRFIQFFGETSDELFQRCVTALRYRPDMLVVGEVRGREVVALVRAIASGSGSATTFHASSPEEFEMAMRNLLPRDLYAMLSVNTALLISISKVKIGSRVERRVIAVYERIGDGWRQIYDEEHDRISQSYILRRIARRLLIDDIESELEKRTKILEQLDQGYESVEKFLKRFYGI